MKKILITGGGGMVGSNISFFLKDIYQVYASDINTNFQIKGCKMLRIDITDKETTIKIISEIQPDYIIHLAALTDVSTCEKNKKLAKRINVIGVENVTKAAKEVQAKLIYTSTNYIFDGLKGMYKEEDQPIPLNYYSKTKLEGEAAALSYPNSIIARICPFGLDIKNKSFISWLYNNLTLGNEIKLYADQFFSPLHTFYYARAFYSLLESNFNGIIHIAGKEKLSRYEFAKKFAETFQLDTNLLKPIKIEDIKENATRPKDTSLDIAKASDLLGSILKNASLEQGMLLMKKEKDSGFLENFSFS